MTEHAPEETHRQIQKLAGSIRWLGIIVFFNCLLLVGLIVVLFSTWIPIMVTQAYQNFDPQVGFTDRSISIRVPTPGFTESIVHTSQQSEQGQPFAALPTPIKSRIASVIIVVENREDSDGQVEEVITQILKHEPGVKFPYNIGDIYNKRAPIDLPPGIEEPPGSVYFFLGNPAEFDTGSSYDDEGRIAGENEITIEELKAIIDEQK